MLLSRAAKSKRTSSRKMLRFAVESGVSCCAAESSAPSSGGGEGSWVGGVYFRRESLPRRLRVTRWKGRSSTERRRGAWRASVVGC